MIGMTILVQSSGINTFSGIGNPVPSRLCKYRYCLCDPVVTPYLSNPRSASTRKVVSSLPGKGYRDRA